MQTIDVETSQHVPLTFELASVMERLGALLIDFILMWIGLWGLSVFGEWLVPRDYFQYYVLLVPVPFALFYSLAWEVFNRGASPGKLVLNIRVIRLSTHQHDATPFLLRWVFRGLEIYSTAGTLAALFVNASSKRQRIGDLLGNTAVVRARSKYRVRLAQLEKLNEAVHYEAVFPEALRLTDQDILVLREVIDRHKRFTSTESRALLAETRDHLEHVVGKAPKSMTDRELVVQVVKDYVALTR